MRIDPGSRTLVAAGRFGGCHIDGHWLTVRLDSRNARFGLGGLIDTALRLFAALALVVANAGFVAAEFALVAVDRARIDERAGQGQARAVAVQGLLSKLSYHLSGAQLGITITSLLLGVLAEPAVARVLEPGLEAVFGDVPGGVSIAVALIVATVVQMVFGELVPKAIATTRPLETSLVMARPTQVYGVLARPLVAFLDGLAAQLTRRVGVEPAEELETIPDRGELEHLIRSSGEEGTLDEGEVELLTRSIRLAEKSADDAMVPRVRVESVGSDTTVQALVSVASRTGHSRFPVEGEDLDDIVGVVHVKSVHGVAVEARAATPVTDLMSPVLAVPESRELDELLVDLRQGGMQLAVVIDEHGGTAGIITLEDVLEEIVGEIDDEYDDAPTMLTRVEARGSTVMPGSLHPDEVEDATGFEMPEGEYETLAGLLLDRLGHIPEPGEMVDVDGWRLEVVAMERLRIATVRVVAPEEPVAGVEQ
ncbi:MAG: hemolysin family protein [Actinomycetota bacterium]